MLDGFSQTVQKVTWKQPAPAALHVSIHTSIGKKAKESCAQVRCIPADMPQIVVNYCPPPFALLGAHAANGWAGCFWCVW